MIRTGTYCLFYSVILLGCLGNSFSAMGQNLVPNSDFSQFSSCPVQRGQLALATPWFSPNGRTSDFVHTCSGVALTAVPQNNWGTQAPYAGWGYAGIRTWAPDLEFGIPYREYLAVALLDTLIAGESYFVSFQVSPGDSSGYFTDDIGLAFTDTAIPSQSLLTYNTAIRNEAGQYLDNTQEWTEISGEYLARGGERYLIIGNFWSDSATTVQARPREIAPLNSTYFYIDGVQVESCQSRVPDALIESSDSSICPGESLTLTVHEGAQQDYQWLDGSSSPVRVVTQPGIYTLLAEIRGCSVIDSFEVLENPGPDFELGQDTVLCLGESILLAATDTASDFLWSDGIVSPSRVVSQPGTYTLIGVRGNCVKRQSIRVDYAEMPEAQEQLDTTICQSQTLLLWPGIKGNSYLWNDLSTGDSLVAADPGWYWVNIRTRCYDVRENFVVRIEDCGCDAFIPNVISPNGDGINDAFQIEMREGVRDFYLEISDRWGRQLYSSRNPTDGWRGYYGAKPVSPGVYFWSLRYRCVESGEQQLVRENGTLTLFR